MGTHLYVENFTNNHPVWHNYLQSAENYVTLYLSRRQDGSGGSAGGAVGRDRPVSKYGPAVLNANEQRYRDETQ